MGRRESVGDDGEVLEKRQSTTRKRQRGQA